MASNVELSLVIKALDQTKAAFQSAASNVTTLKGKVSTGFSGMATHFKNFAGGATKHVIGSIKSMLTSIGPLLGIAGFAGLALSIKKTVDAYGAFDTAMKNVQKTTGMTGDELATLGDTFKKMSTIIPKSASELSEIGAVAGQLGIQGSENIAVFTESVAKVSVALGMAEEDAATAMAKLAAAFQEPVENVERFASSVNELENTTAAASKEIISSMVKMAPGAATLGILSQESAALGATLVSMGVDGARAGTELNRVFTESAIKWRDMAEMMSMDSATAAQMMEEDFMGFFMKFLQHLQAMPSDVERLAVANEVFGAVGAKAVNGLVLNYDALIKNLGTANDAYAEGNSLTKEAETFYGSFENQIKLLKNQLNLAAISVGERLAPALLRAGAYITENVLPAFMGFAGKVGDIFSDIATEVWPVIEALGQKLAGVFESLLPTIKEVLKETARGYIDFGSHAAEGVSKLGSKLKEVVIDSGAVSAAMQVFRDIMVITGEVVGFVANKLADMIAWLQKNYALIPGLKQLVDTVKILKDGIHKLAEKFRDEEDYLRGIEEATRDLTDAKEDLIEANERLAGAGEDLASTLKETSLWSARLQRLEDKSKASSDKLAKARAIAAAALENYGEGSKEAEEALAALAIAEAEHEANTEDYSDALEETVDRLVDTGVASDELKGKFYKFKDAQEDVIAASEEVNDALSGVEDAEGALASKTDSVTGEVTDNFSGMRSGIVSTLTELGSDFVAFGEDTLSHIKSGVESLASSFVDLGKWVAGKIVEGLEWLWDLLPSWLKDILSGGGGAAATSAAAGSVVSSTGGTTTTGGSSGSRGSSSSVASSVASAATNAASSAVSAATNAASSAASAATSATSAANSAASSAVSSIANAVSSVASAATSAVSSAVSAATSAATSAVSAVTSAASSAVSAATSAVSSAASAVSGALSGVLGSYQTGGYVQETGLAYLHRGEYVVPKKEQRSNLVTVENVTYFNAPIYGVDDLNRLLDDHDRELLKKIRMAI